MFLGKEVNLVLEQHHIKSHTQIDVLRKMPHVSDEINHHQAKYRLYSLVLKVESGPG